MQFIFTGFTLNFSAMVYGTQEDTDLSPEYAKMIKRDERRWKVADYDGNELLDRTEYGCFMHPEDCDHMREIVVMVGALKSVPGRSSAS